MKASTSTCRNWLVKGAVGGGGGGRNWMSPRMQMCQSAQAMPGFGWAMEPGPGLIYSKRYKEFTSQGKILFRIISYFHLSVFTPKPNTTKCLPYLTLVNLDISSMFFPSSKTIRSLFFISFLFLPLFRKRTADQKVAGVLL